ncbi:MAG TPA: sodium:proton antiporter, partial [Bacteroidia bacterium]|nr:sodium:proton antiporter [Bacteroidia bacterium]
KSFNEINKEFVVYESSFSDIIGVVLFNFFVTTEIINLTAGLKFTSDLIFILIITCLSTIASAVLLYKINTHVKHVPLLALILLVYAITKLLHLPGLIYILILGLVFSNASMFNKFKIFKKVRFDNFNAEVNSFTDLVIEATFLIRILFFTLFGFSLNLDELISTTELPYSIAFVVLIFLSRAVLLHLYKLPLVPVLFVAPRGLITILLFLSVPITSQLPLINKTLLIQMVLLTAFVLIFGGLLNKKSNL